MKTDKATLGALVRNDFLVFLEKAFKTLNPTATYLPNWHIEALAYGIQEFLDGDESVFVVNMPPRSLKSITVSVAYVAWRLGLDPSLSFMVVSHNQDLARMLANDFRRIVQAKWYLEYFPKMRAEPTKNTETDFVTTQNGGRFATSLKGSGTGRGADILIFDDPNKADDIESEAERKAAINAYRNTFATRHNDPQNAKTIVVQQRIHDEDLSGHILKHEDCRHLKLPAISPGDEVFQIGASKRVRYKEGSILHKGRYSHESLEQLKKKLGATLFAAQYLQDPVPEDGDIIKWDWMRVFHSPPAREPGDMLVCSWDTAGTVKAYSSYSVGTVWLCRKDGNYLLEVIRERLKYPQLKQRVIDTAKSHGADLILVENAHTGQTLYQDISQSTNLAITAITPKTDKVTRMTPCTALMEAGRVFIPAEAPWLPEFKRELLQFPNAKYDDQADSVSLFLNWARERDFGPPQLEVKVTAIYADGSSFSF